MEPYTALKLAAEVVMEQNRNLLAVWYGVGAYIALFFIADRLPELVVLCFPGKEPWSSLELRVLVSIACLPLTFVLAPALRGFVIARTARDWPYLYLLYASVVCYILLAFAGYGPSSMHRERMQGYGLLILLSLFSSVVGTWFGSLQKARRKDEELMQQLRDL